MLFDRDGAARSATRTRPCLIGLPEGEGSALTLAARGVWLVQIPLAQKTKAAEPTAARKLTRTAQSGHLTNCEILHLQPALLPFAALSTSDLIAHGQCGNALS